MVCFLRVTALFPFPRIEGPTTQPTSFFGLYVAPFTLLPSFHSIEQCLRGVGMNTVSVLSCGISNQKISKPISHWKARVTSDRCVILEATHRSKRCCGLGVHTVSFAWCKCTRDGTTLVVTSGTTHMHGQAMSTNLFIMFLWFANVFLPFAVLHPTRELRFLAMGGSTSYWSLSTVHRLPQGRRHLQPKAGAVGGIGFSRSIV
jgi:hypothetical protein